MAESEDKDTQNGSVLRLGGALKDGASALSRAGVEAPIMTAQILLAHTLGWDRVRLIAHDRDPLSSSAGARYFALIGRRAAGEPLQYLTGEREFYGLSFRVAPGVLIPRPETEILVERTLDLCGALQSKAPMRFADVGTGCGCIAIAVARKLPTSLGWAVDVSPDALSIALENAERHGVTSRLRFLCGDLLEGIRDRPMFHFILCNLPYVPRRDQPILEDQVRDFEPPLALYGGESGLEIIERAIPQAARRLLPGGRLLLEVGAGQSGEVTGMLERQGLLVGQVLRDLQGIPRCIVAERVDGRASPNGQD